MSLADLAPTFLEAAGTLFDGVSDGSSLLVLLSGREHASGWRSELLLEGGTQAGSTAVVTRDWKLIRWHDGFAELYDRHEDPGELYNIAGQEKSTARALSWRMEEKNR